MDDDVTADEMAQAVEEEILPVVADLRAVADELMSMVAKLRRFREAGRDGDVS